MTPKPDTSPQNIARVLRELAEVLAIGGNNAGTRSVLTFNARKARALADAIDTTPVSPAISRALTNDAQRLAANEEHNATLRQKLERALQPHHVVILSKIAGTEDQEYTVSIRQVSADGKAVILAEGEGYGQWYGLDGALNIALRDAFPELAPND